MLGCHKQRKSLSMRIKETVSMTQTGATLLQFMHVYTCERFLCHFVFPCLLMQFNVPQTWMICYVLPLCHTADVLSQPVQ